MEEVNHDRIKSKRKKKNEEKSSQEDGADSNQLEEGGGGGGGGGRDGRNEEKKKRDEKRKKKREEARKKEKDSEASVSRLEEGRGEEGESREGSRVSVMKDKEGKSCEIEKKKQKEKDKRKCEGDDGKERSLDSEETNKKMKKKEKRIDLEEKVSSDNQVEDSNKKKNEKKKDETGLEEIGEENEEDGDFKKKKTIKDKRKREEDTTNGNKRAKKTSKSVEKDSNGKKKKKNDGKRVRFSGEVEVFPSGRESEEGEADEEKMVQGKRFTKEEDKMILQAIDDYIEKHQLGENGSQMILQCSRHKELRNCWDEIITCMPYRPKYAIYNRAHVLLTRSQIRNWSTEDYEALKKHKEMHGAKWKEFADKHGINRKAVKDAWRRIRLPNAKTGGWSQEEYQMLFDLVNTDLKMKAFEEKKTMHGMLKDNIAWEAISDKLATRLHYYCCIKWYDQLSSPMVKEGLWLDTDDYRLIQALQKTDANCLEEVEWDHILEHREGEICRKRWEQMIRYIGDHKEKSFIEQVELLSKRYCPDMIEVREKYDGNEFADK